MVSKMRVAQEYYNEAVVTWDMWKQIAGDDPRAKGPFMKLYISLMQKSDADMQFLRYLFPDHPEKARDAIEQFERSIYSILVVSDLQPSAEYAQFLATMCAKRMRALFSPLSLKEQIDTVKITGEPIIHEI